MPNPSRSDRNQLPGTQSANTPEGAVADGRMAAIVEITLYGTPSQVQADYNTLAGTSLTANSTIRWRKR